MRSHGRQRRAAVAPGVETEPWVVVLAAGEPFGLPVSRLVEVDRAARVTPVDGAPLGVAGTLDHQGRPLPVLDLAWRLGLAEPGVAPASRVLIVRAQGRLVALAVERVEVLTELAPAARRPLPPEVLGSDSGFLAGVVPWRDGWLMQLDVDRLLRLPQPGRRQNDV